MCLLDYDPWFLSTISHSYITEKLLPAAFNLRPSITKSGFHSHHCSTVIRMCQCTEPAAVWLTSLKRMPAVMQHPFTSTVVMQYLFTRTSCQR